ncbi:MAG: hypothetical protein U9N39_00900 [Campylobacterota bacterium]|nr:hypothetical protein [Campylobacterota bacterium]
MRQYLLFFIFSSLPLFADVIDVQKIALKIDKVHSSKISSTLDYRVYDPFATAKPILKKKTIIKRVRHKSIVIETILNNRAFIEKKWYSVGDTIYGQKIKNVRRDGIVILKNYKKTFIPLKKNTNIIKIKENIK